ncbi:M48 family metallopeptidase [Paucibacter sp. DJ2R-2]|uniref:M48 family metallopeptidase n=1 Tax=Paucibacter sp. DJ2R-2 TaxID=2893558 RepID=UPI0021E41D98|nr:M48 family metallopeptidase [Paucibacter sp. DJ2R-2]MCV2419961.1 M48 family metallopeptidase [Paucibacter sp. DJ4R-1]MCV2437112.1 M48 family metallopeptidase [Paucibacter sp. DJ2R-2]
MRRRKVLLAACAQAVAAGGAMASSSASDWVAPSRFGRPDASSDEGGLWALMDREETKLRRSPFLLRDAPLRDYLQGIADKLAGEHAADVRVYPVRTPHFNASMAPNGMMQVWSGLLLRVDNEAQLAAVLGHEIAHYLQRHSIERLRDVKARSAFGLFFGMLGVAGLVGQLANTAGAFGFSRDHEREADAIGLTLMRRAGYDTREAAKVWDNLRSEVQASYGGDPGKSSPMFATHPASEERSASLSAMAAGDSGGFVGSAEFNQRLAGLQRGMLEDELRRGQFGPTLVLLERLIARDPLRSELLYFRGEARRLRAGADDAELALRDFERAMEMGHEPPEVHRSLGYMYKQREEIDSARAAFARYLERAPQAADAAMIRSFL